MKKLSYVLTTALVVGCFVAAVRCSPKKPPRDGGPAPDEIEMPELDGAPSTPPKDGTATIKGKVTLKGTPPVMGNVRGIDGKPDCSDQHTTTPKVEAVITGADGALVNVFVYISRQSRRNSVGPRSA